jgi:hypothetical protein
MTPDTKQAFGLAVLFAPFLIGLIVALGLSLDGLEQRRRIRREQRQRKGER